MFKELCNNPAIMVQGITGTHGSFHTRAMLEAGSRIVCGVTPGKAGEMVHGVPVYNTVSEARARHNATISVVFVPARFAKDALFEAIDAGVKFIVCITEGIPVHDMLAVLQKARVNKVTVLGPNCPGLLIPGVIKLGIIPAAVGSPGNAAIVSRSGTLTYEAAASLTTQGVGQRYIIGIGGDRIHGLSFTDCLGQFEADDSVSRIILIGEIGGNDEQQAAAYIKNHISKPVYAYVVGQSAPAETQLGHAGAILGSADESAAAKTKSLKDAGAITAKSLPLLLKSL
ncbi:MAG TPA: succinate--CoA ligase subunit alpha [Candidatus Saccharimonadales bacterium]